MRITVQILNGASGKVLEVVADVDAPSPQAAVNILLDRARRGGTSYFRFLSDGAVTPPTMPATVVEYRGQTYWANEN